MTESQRLAKFMAVEGELHRSQGRETLAGYFGQAAAELRRLDAECEQLRADAGRLDWLLWKLPGDSIRYCVGEISDNIDGAEFRTAIDKAMKETK